MSALYHKTKSLWICVMTHALINMLSQIAVGGNIYIAILGKVVVICMAVYIVKTVVGGKKNI